MNQARFIRWLIDRIIDALRLTGLSDTRESQRQDVQRPAPTAQTSRKAGEERETVTPRQSNLAPRPRAPIIIGTTDDGQDRALGDTGRFRPPLLTNAAGTSTRRSKGPAALITIYSTDGHLLDDDRKIHAYDDRFRHLYEFSPDATWSHISIGPIDHRYWVAGVTGYNPPGAPVVNHLAAYETDGTQLWVTTIGTGIGVMSAYCAATDTLYVLTPDRDPGDGTVTGTSSTIFAIDMTDGSKETIGTVSRQTWTAWGPTLFYGFAVSLDGSVAFVGVNDADVDLEGPSILGIDTDTGSQLWEYKTTLPYPYVSNPVDSGPQLQTLHVERAGLVRLADSDALVFLMTVVNLDRGDPEHTADHTRWTELHAERLNFPSGIASAPSQAWDMTPMLPADYPLSETDWLGSSDYRNDVPLVLNGQVFVPARDSNHRWMSSIDAATGALELNVRHLCASMFSNIGRFAGAAYVPSSDRLMVTDRVDVGNPALGPTGSRYEVFAVNATTGAELGTPRWHLAEDSSPEERVWGLVGLEPPP